MFRIALGPGGPVKCIGSEPPTIIQTRPFRIRAHGYPMCLPIARMSYLPNGDTCLAEGFVCTRGKRLVLKNYAVVFVFCLSLDLFFVTRFKIMKEMMRNRNWPEERQRRAREESGRRASVNDKGRTREREGGIRESYQTSKSEWVGERRKRK